MSTRKPAAAQEAGQRKTSSTSEAAVPPDPLGASREVDLDILPDLSGYMIRRAQLVIWQDFLRSLSEFEITPAQFSALTVIAANPGIIQTSLANALAIERSAMVLLIDGLESRGLAVRVPSTTDRRSRALFLTASGQAFLADVRQRVLEHEARVTSEIKPHNKKVMLRSLHKIVARERRPGASADDSST